MAVNLYSFIFHPWSHLKPHHFWDLSAEKVWSPKQWTIPSVFRHNSLLVCLFSRSLIPAFKKKKLLDDLLRKEICDTKVQC